MRDLEAAALLRVIPPIGAALIRLLARTTRIRRIGEEVIEDLARGGHRVILAFWHSRQLMMPFSHARRPAWVLISQHRDGELIARIVSRFGYQAVRGSTTRGGAAALRQLIRLGRSNADLFITPDGPKGPREIVQPGVVQLARATALPVVPLAFGCSKKNSSGAGTGSRSRTHSAAACSSGVRPFGSRGTRMSRCSSVSASRSRRPCAR